MLAYRTYKGLRIVLGIMGPFTERQRDDFREACRAFGFSEATSAPPVEYESPHIFIIRSSPRA